MQKKKRKKPPYGVSAKHAAAIGYMTIHFNWLEHGIEVLIEMIVSPADHGMAEPIVRRTEFVRKVNTLFQRLLIMLCPPQLSHGDVNVSSPR
jgi:hypothetical protein